MFGRIPYSFSLYKPTPWRELPEGIKEKKEKGDGKWKCY
jgi:hypothetical protein